MGRIASIENIASSGLALYNNLKVIVRGRPRFLDPQLDGGNLRFAIKRGFNFSAIIPDNQTELSEDAYKDSTRVVMAMRPRWMLMKTLVRIGNSEAIGEMHRVADVIDDNTIDLDTPLVANYSASPDQTTIPVASLVGTPCKVVAHSSDQRRIVILESWNPIVPEDTLLMSSTSDVLESLREYKVKRANLIAKRDGNKEIGEPALIYRYEIELNTKTGLLPFTPALDLTMYLKASPLFFRDGYGVGDIEIPQEIGPFILDAFYGSLLIINETNTKIGIQAWDSFGVQLSKPLIMVGDVSANSSIITNIVSTKGLKAGQAITGYGLQRDTVILSYTKTTVTISKSAVSSGTGQLLSVVVLDQPWQETPENYLVLERPIASDSLLFWQRIMGNFQYQKNGFFQAELTDAGKFSFSSGLLVPQWPSDREYGWVIPVFCRSEVTCVVQFEPQEQQIYTIPSNSLTFIRPKVRFDTNNTPITRILISFKGSPNARVEIRDWQFDGQAIVALSYYLLGSDAAYGQTRWLAGGLSAKPLFFNMASLKAHYSDGVSAYNSGQIYI